MVLTIPLSLSCFFFSSYRFQISKLSHFLPSLTCPRTSNEIGAMVAYQGHLVVLEWQSLQERSNREATSAGSMILSAAVDRGGSGISTLISCSRSSAAVVQPMIWSRVFTDYFAFPVIVHCPVTAHAGQRPSKPAMRGSAPR